ncbi:hypothetical protein OAC48_00505 [Porticoccaceae bacterium]|jgi:hypothetical protein|nr:hypothetical protein [Porticoccaceae bacterium]|tara:strand:+ start:12607 stop:13434 length:828 start_codon:yes stop_codon:yes gene_type:complete
MWRKKLRVPLFGLAMLVAPSAVADPGVELTDGVDASASGGASYIVRTPAATYYLDKAGGGLSSILDNDGVDWIGFHSEPGSGWKGEYRGFPNAVHRQDGNYFHAMNTGTDPSSSVVDVVTDQHLSILFTSGNGQWQGRWDFYPNRCDFTMTKVSQGYHYWVQYEGVPGGEMDASDFWYSSADDQRHQIEQPFIGDLPAPEWMAFGDEASPRMLYLLHHEDDDYPDDYVSRPYMTVLGFGRRNKDKYLDSVQKFSIGFVESTDYSFIDRTVRSILD